MKNILTMAAGAVLLAASGCATHDAGGRHAYVQQVYGVHERPADLPDCLARLTPAQLQGARFVSVKYGTMRLRKYTTALAPAGMALARHDQVELATLACDSHDYPRIKGVIGG